MCGLIYVKRFDGKKAQKMVCKRYEFQKERGKEGFGYVAIDDNFVVDCKKSHLEATILKEIRNSSANEMLYHHRFPTSAPNFPQTAHPITVCHDSLKYNYYVVHNGIISNDLELRTEQLKLGFFYTTDVKKQYKFEYYNETIDGEVEWNDSEALAIELARDLDGQATGLGHVRGSIAFIALQVDKVTSQVVKLYYGRNTGSPLLFDVTDDYMALTSLGKGTEIKTDVLYAYDYHSGMTLEKNYKVGIAYVVTSYNYNRNEYPDSDYDNRRLAGFTKATDRIDRDLALLDRPKEPDEEMEFDEYWDLLEDRIQAEGILKDGNISATERMAWEDELINLNAAIKEYEDRFATKHLERATLGY